MKIKGIDYYTVPTMNADTRYQLQHKLDKLKRQARRDYSERKDRN